MYIWQNTIHFPHEVQLRPPICHSLQDAQVRTRTATFEGDGCRGRRSAALLVASRLKAPFCTTTGKREQVASSNFSTSVANSDAVCCTSSVFAPACAPKVLE